MLFEKIWQLLRIFFWWLFWMFSVSWNYEFIWVFTNLFIVFFWIWIWALVVSYFFWNNSIVKEWIWNNAINSPVSLIIKTWVFVLTFVFTYFLIEWIIPKVIINVQYIQETWMTLSARNEWFQWENWEDLKKRIVMVWWYLNWIDYSNANFDDNSQIWWNDYWWYAFKQFDLNKTKINFSPREEKWSWRSVIDYSMWYISEKWELIANNWKIHMFTIHDMLNQTKDTVNCWENMKKFDTLTNYWWDIYWYLLSNVKDTNEVKKNIFIADNITDITKIFNKIRKKYIFTDVNSLQDLTNTTANKTTIINLYHAEILQKLLCLPDFSKTWTDTQTQQKSEDKKQEWNTQEKKDEKKEEPKKEEKKEENKTDEQKTQENDNDSNTIKAIKRHLSEIKSYLLFLDRMSEKSNRWIENEDNKFMFIVSILQNSWDFSQLQWHDVKWSMQRNLKLSEYTTLSFPLVINLKNWDKIVNNWICYNYIFDWQLWSKLKWLWFSELLTILKTWCWWSFWWIYDYTWNNIDKLWPEYYSRIIRNINDWKTIDDQNWKNDSTWIRQWYYVYESYWSLSWITPTWLQLNNSVSVWLWNVRWDELNKKDALPEYEDRISSVSWIIKLINSYKNLMFSLFLYLLPWVFIVFILKLIKLNSK